MGPRAATLQRHVVGQPTKYWGVSHCCPHCKRNRTPSCLGPRAATLQRHVAIICSITIKQGMPLWMDRNIRLKIVFVSLVLAREQRVPSESVEIVNCCMLNYVPTYISHARHFSHSYTIYEASLKNVSRVRSSQALGCARQLIEAEPQAMTKDTHSSSRICRSVT